MVELRIASLARVVQQEAVAVSGPEDECLASSELLASIAAVGGGGSTISDSAEVGADTRSVIGDIDSIVVLSGVAEVGAKSVQVATRVKDGRTRDNGGGGGGSGNCASLEGCGEGCHTGCVSGSDGRRNISGDNSLGRSKSVGLGSLSPVENGFRDRVYGRLHSLGPGVGQNLGTCN